MPERSASENIRSTSENLRSASETLRSAMQRKPSGVLRSFVPPVSPFELPPTSNMDPTCPTDTLSLRCTCGYVKHDVICLGDVIDKDQKIFQFCGGLFIIRDNGIECSRCRKTAKSVNFTCAFCDESRDFPIGSRLLRERRATDSVHSTVIFDCPKEDIPEINGF